MEDFKEVGISVKLPLDKWEAFSRLAKEEGQSMAGIIRNMIYNRLKEADNT